MQTNSIIDNLWPASIGWSTNVNEDSGKVLYCYSYGLGCYKGAHSWTGGSMGWLFKLNIHSNNKGIL